jgi:hypothetical protein
MTLDADLRRRAVVRAQLHPDRLLAAALAEYPDEDLAAAIGAPSASCWRLRLMGFPRDTHWADDVQRMAEAVEADPRLLGRLLVERGVRP